MSSFKDEALCCRRWAKVCMGALVKDRGGGLGFMHGPCSRGRGDGVTEIQQ